MYKSSLLYPLKWTETFVLVSNMYFFLPTKRGVIGKLIN